ncbi:MarR family winged helix-turn-helix transcriptional regulator [Bacillus badius]|uniref:Transcriptional regulator, MarR family n=1 Tax=Bacillus badius TaxID=1455 RepID=A0ABR5AV20_BACBA|nr:MarR family transcriptional regulator [Bacillus badius]KIL76470.1 Transcriptional regulator, MarR family [Bacillus badius]KIL78587.1 Transcriptional regulator, MarR family [Bacillus badius]TDW04074.1 DNA-binding MarR family transcriptional regulator [Bacillus badius]GLY09100.1 MarR family transcriptional regulator [Bacillus badius]
MIQTFQKFFYQFLLLYRPFENQLNALLGKHGLYRAQWTVLYYLFNFGPATLVELASYQSVEKPTMTRTVQRLKELGYLEAVPTKDKREKRMQLTEAGVSVYQEVRLTIDAFEEKIIEGISEEEQLEAIRLMKDIQQKITKWEMEM